MDEIREEEEVSLIKREEIKSHTHSTPLENANNKKVSNENNHSN